jgi:hypothetical protein
MAPSTLFAEDATPLSRDEPALRHAQIFASFSRIRSAPRAMPVADFVGSPWIRRCRHSGFSLARRTIRRATPGCVRGCPGLPACSRRASSPPACGARPAASLAPGEDSGPAPAPYRDFSGNSPKHAPAEEPGGYDLITVPGFRIEAPRHVTPTDIKSVTRFHLHGQVRYPVCLGIGQMPFTDHRPAIRQSQSHPRRSRYRPKAWLPRLGGIAASLVLCAVRTSLAAYRS